MASQATPTKIKIYLSFFDASGYQSRLEQLQTGSHTAPVRHFLANEDTDGPLFLVGHKDELHSHACLDVYASVVTLCVFEEPQQGTWVLPPGWRLGSSNILDRVLVKCSSGEQETVIQLRPGDQILSKGGRFAIDFFMRQGTPNLLNSCREQACTIDIQTGISQRSHYSQLDNTSQTCPTTPSLQLLHCFLEMDEPSRAISWSMAAYCYEENQVVLQVSLCQHYRSTFEAYGSLISPLILLKAVIYAFPHAFVEKKLEAGIEYIVKGIRPREELLEVSHLTAQNHTEITTRPRLRKIHLDSEAVSPDILEGMETPAWKIVEDSQALLSSHLCNGIEPDEEPEALGSPILAIDAPISENASVAIQPVQGTSSDIPENRTLAIGNFETHDTRVHTPLLNQTSSELEVAEGRGLRNGPQVNQGSTDGKEPRSVVVTDAPDDQVQLEESEYNVEDDTGHVLANQANENQPSSPRQTSRSTTNIEDGDLAIRDAESLVKEKMIQEFSNCGGKRSLLTGEALLPAKKAKTSKKLTFTNTDIANNDTLQPHDELDGDTIVVENEASSSQAHVTNAGNRSRSRESDSSGSRVTVDPVTPSQSTKRQSQSSQKSSGSASAHIKLSKQYGSDSPRIIFSSSTKIDRNKNIMSFLRKCGGKLVKDITAATMLCVASDQPLKKTANLVMAICMGLDIVTETWLVHSQRKGFLLDAQPYLPKDSQKEGEWKFKLEEAVARGKMRGAMTNLLAGTAVYFLQGLKSLLANNFRDFTKVATCLGADAVRHGLPKGKEGKEEREILILGIVDDAQTIQASEMGYEVWSKDLLVMGALRGHIERTDEFNIAKPMKHEGTMRNDARSGGRSVN